jgi:hypothetical protein
MVAWLASRFEIAAAILDSRWLTSRIVMPHCMMQTYDACIGRIRGSL